MQETIIQLINQFGYFAIGLLMAVENIFPPIPSEVILTFSGFMTTYTDMNVVIVILSATIGTMIGTSILYFVGRLISPEHLMMFVDSRAGKLLRLSANDISSAYKWFAKRGNITVFICRFVPIVRSLISIPAGTAKMNFGVFLMLTLLGTAIWNTVLVVLGSFAGEAWESVLVYIDRYSTIALIALLLVILLAVFRFYRHKVNRK